MPTWNERFCQMMLLARIGFEMVRQVPADCPVGQVGGVAKVSVSSVEFRVLLTPAGCGHDALLAAPVPPVRVQFPAGALAIGVPMLLVSTPEVARLSLWAMVLLTICTFNASCNEMPAPSQPATLLTMMLLVMFTLFQRLGLPGKVETSVPLTWLSRMPPPLPLSAEFPWIRLALITRL
jgi:hypothetical protein